MLLVKQALTLKDILERVSFRVSAFFNGMKSKEVGHTLKKKEKEYERQDFWCFTENRKIFYASDCNSSGGGSAALNRKFVYK